mmetsp:Transcript_7632/g.22573  ORF Transcript_7632/g.22573 Transcript_7632/m.22573 type:complete len:249 (+) Transcript_7632:3025-3771(+)
MLSPTMAASALSASDADGCKVAESAAIVSVTALGRAAGVSGAVPSACSVSPPCWVSGAGITSGTVAAAAPTDRAASEGSVFRAANFSSVASPATSFGSVTAWDGEPVGASAGAASERGTTSPSLPATATDCDAGSPPSLPTDPATAAVEAAVAASRVSCPGAAPGNLGTGGGLPASSPLMESPNVEPATATAESLVCSSEGPSTRAAVPPGTPAGGVVSELTSPPDAVATAETGSAAASEAAAGWTGG